jgi:hypothetical protein
MNEISSSLFVTHVSRSPGWAHEGTAHRLAGRVPMYTGKGAHAGRCMRRAPVGSALSATLREKTKPTVPIAAGEIVRGGLRGEAIPDRIPASFLGGWAWLYGGPGLVKDLKGHRIKG